MAYCEYKPTPLLAEYVDAYWSVKVVTADGPVTQRIIPDTCADIIISLGSTVIANKDGVNQTTMHADKAYLVGTMTTFCDTLFENDAHLVGIRFRPFALHSVLGIPLSGIKDKTHELSYRDFCFKELIASKNINHLQKAFDTFLFNKLNAKDKMMKDVMESISQSRGMVTIENLAKKHFMTERKLERLCQLKTGITIKELCKQVRFQHTLNLLKKNKHKQSITDIAWETGYYDHSHLTRDMKKYTGHAPSYYMH